MDGMNQYFEWKVKLAGGKTGSSSSSSEFGSSLAGGDIGGQSDMDIGALVPIERV